jgi:hypothetical protein
MFYDEDVQRALGGHPEMLELWEEHSAMDNIPCFHVSKTVDGANVFCVVHMSINEFLMASAFYRFASCQEPSERTSHLPSFLGELTPLTQQLFRWFEGEVSGFPVQ